MANGPGLAQVIHTMPNGDLETFIAGAIEFAEYASGGQYARIWVTEPGVVQTLSPMYLAPDADNKARFAWPAIAIGEYTFCIQTFSLSGATNGEKVCSSIDIEALPSSPSASMSPSASVSRSVSPSVSPSISPSASLSPSASESPSPSGSASSSISPSASVSPSGPAPLAIEFMSGAEHEVNPTEKWNVANHTPPVSGVDGAHGRVYDNSVWGLLSKTITTTQFITGKVRMRLRVSSDNETILTLMDGAGFQLWVAYRSTGALQVANGGGVKDVSDAGLIALDTHYEMEWYAKIDNTTGEFSFLLDGVEIMSAIGIDTQATANAQVTQWRAGSAVLDTYMDDCVIDVEGNSIGLGQVETLYPDGAGDLAEMTRGGTDSGANWSQVDEAVHNIDTDYVFNTVADKRDCYTFQNRSIIGTPLAVQAVATIKRHVSGTFTFRIFCRIAGVNYDGAIQTTSNAYLCFREIWNTNPATGNAWADSEINAAQFGYQAIDANIRATQIVLEIYIKE